MEAASFWGATDSTRARHADEIVEAYAKLSRRCYLRESRDTGGVPIIERVASRGIYRNPWLVLLEDEIRPPDGSPGIYGGAPGNGAPGSGRTDRI